MTWFVSVMLEQLCLMFSSCLIQCCAIDILIRNQMPCTWKAEQTMAFDLKNGMTLNSVNFDGKRGFCLTLLLTYWKIWLKCYNHYFCRLKVLEFVMCFVDVCLLLFKMLFKVFGMLYMQQTAVGLITRHLYVTTSRLTHCGLAMP